jgi:uncharacterized membrane protein
MAARHWTLLVSGIALALAPVLAPPVHADESAGRTERPERGLSMYTEYSRVTVPGGETVRMDLTLDNRGKHDENVLLTLAKAPPGWKAAIKGGGYEVGGVPVEATKTRVLTFTAEPTKGLQPGTYTFQIDGVTADHAITLSQPVVVTALARKAGQAGALQISTSYPVLRGPTDSSFEFSLEVSNKTDADHVVNLSADAPKGWEVSFKPAYESKQISSLRIKAGASQTVALDVKAPPEARAGEFPITFHATTEGGQADARLQVVLTGTYKLDAETPSGRLSLDAVLGKPATMTLLVRNTGSADNHAVKLSGIGPENWKIDFSPKTIDSLAPDAVKPVEVTLTPAAQALVGDYSVQLTADGEQSSNKTVEMRVTAHASSRWGWIGVGIIVGVIGGLGGLFTWLGRR